MEYLNIDEREEAMGFYTSITSMSWARKLSKP
jgi:hypothetical protein